MQYLFLSNSTHDVAVHIQHSISPWQRVSKQRRCLTDYHNHSSRFFPFSITLYLFLLVIRVIIFIVEVLVQNDTNGTGQSRYNDR